MTFLNARVIAKITGVRAIMHRAMSQSMEKKKITDAL